MFLCNLYEFYNPTESEKGLGLALVHRMSQDGSSGIFIDEVVLGSSAEKCSEIK